jgi:signal transduction histidine kinase
LVTVTRDISSRKKIEQELIAAKEKAEESDRLKTAFLQGINHEIRTPMNGILGFASLLKELDLSGDQQTEFIVSIEKSGNRMIETITTIVNTALIQTGQMEVSLSETNVNKLIKQTLTRYKPDSDEKGLDFSCNCPSGTDDLIISTDDEKLGFILSHLVKNAIKFTDKGYIYFGYTLKGASVTVGVDAKTDLPAETQVGKPNRAVELEFFVKDTGIGIPQNRQSAIFAPFQHADIANIRAFQGIGLGLSVSKAYIEMLGGEIRLESKEGEGASFYFTLPVR